MTTLDNRTAIDSQPPSMRQLPMLPEHWKWRKLRHVTNFSVSNVDKHTHDDEQAVRLCNYVDVYRNEFITANLPFMRATATSDEIEQYRLKLDEVVITKDSELWSDIGVPALVRYAAEDLICGYHLAILRPRQSHLSGEYLLRCLQVPHIAVQLHVAANGITRYGLSQTAIKDCQIPLPPLAEQEAIVRFIRYLDHRVNRFIKAKRRLIALLNEQKQAIIQRAVTRGLDLTVPLKPSGIEWLGDVPAHWHVHRIASLATSLQTGPFGSQLHFHEYVEGGVPVINPSHMLKGRIASEPHCSVAPQKAKELERHKCAEGDILFARRGELGRCALVTEADAGFLCGTGSLRMRVLNSKVTSAYLVQLMQIDGPREWLSLRSVGSTMENLNQRILASLPLPIPPLPEQVRILEYISKEAASVEAVAAKTRAEIDLIREYRTRLVSDVVTGQLDVRHLELPEAEDEPLSLGDESDDADELAGDDLLEDDELAEAAL